MNAGNRIAGTTGHSGRNMACAADLPRKGPVKERDTATAFRFFRSGLQALTAITLFLFIVFATTGCTPGGEVADDVEGVQESGSEATVAEVDTSAMDFDYSTRDLDASYDDATATHVALDGSTATVDGMGVTVDGSTVTITGQGTYVISGTLDDGQLVVEAPEDVKVQVVLEGVEIHNEDGPAIYVKQADTCFITLASGTHNTLTDGADYALEEGSDEPYATLFSKEDLTLNGEGTLSVTSSYRHAICSKDDLVITGGTYVIDAAEDALRGRDCVKICGGDFTITAAGDGIKSNNDEDVARGFVTIDGGTFAIEAGDDGVQAFTYLRVMDGDMDITAVDDALHSDGEALVAGGNLSIEAGDDAVHAETMLSIEGGTVQVADCYEGYEAEKIYVNGGETHIVARDDAINAATAETSTDENTEATAGGFDGANGAVPRSGESANENMLSGGAPQTGMAEGGVGMSDENCLVQINGGYTVLDSGGDGVDSNGSVQVTDGVLLVSGPTDSANGVFDYDLEATISGGTVIMTGSTGMAQNFTSGEQPFSLVTAKGSGGQSIAVVDESGTTIASFLPDKQFGMVLVSTPSFIEGGSYSLVVGGEVSGGNADGYTDAGSVTGGEATSFTASTTATSGMGGLGSDGVGQGPGVRGNPGSSSSGPS